MRSSTLYPLVRQCFELVGLFMTEYIYVFPRKRKERPPIYSPQETKRISDLHEEEYAESSSEVEIISAMNMTEVAVNSLQSPFEKNESRITTLENEHVVLKREVEDLTRVNLNTKEVDKKQASGDLENLKGALTELQE